MEVMRGVRVTDVVVIKRDARAKFIAYKVLNGIWAGV
jgi:hypothetical protein